MPDLGPSFRSMNDSTTCQLCGQAATGTETQACGLCCAPHHADCWEYTGLCSTYGCGGIQAVPYSPDLVPRQVAIHEGSRALVPFEERLRTVAQRLARRHGDLAVTLRAGVVGALGATVAMVLMLVALVSPAVLSSPSFLPVITGYVVGLFAAGLGYGVLAPYLAPLQHRAPLRTSLVAGGIAVASFFTGGATGGAAFLITVLAGATSAGTFSEWLVGPHTRFGRQLGAAATPVRYGATAASFFLGSLAASLMMGLPFSLGVVGEIGIWTVLAALAASHSMEVGRAEYRKHLVALVKGDSESSGRDETASDADGLAHLEAVS